MNRTGWFSPGTASGASDCPSVAGPRWAGTRIPPDRRCVHPRSCLSAGCSPAVRIVHGRDAPATSTCGRAFCVFNNILGVPFIFNMFPGSRCRRNYFVHRPASADSNLSGVNFRAPNLFINIPGCTLIFACFQSNSCSHTVDPRTFAFADSGQFQPRADRKGKRQ
jgi:hypothetical protein